MSDFYSYKGTPLSSIFRTNGTSTVDTLKYNGAGGGIKYINTTNPYEKIDSAVGITIGNSDITTLGVAAPYTLVTSTNGQGTISIPSWCDSIKFKITSTMGAQGAQGDQGAGGAVGAGGAQGDQGAIGPNNNASCNFFDNGQNATRQKGGGGGGPGGGGGDGGAGGTGGAGGAGGGGGNAISSYVSTSYVFTPGSVLKYVVSDNAACSFQITNSTQLITYSSITANKGTQGAQGAQGAQGKQGAQGAQGKQGAQGPQGPGGCNDPGSAPASTTSGAVGAQGAQGGAGGAGAQGGAGTSGTIVTSGNVSVSLTDSQQTDTAASLYVYFFKT